MKTLQQIKQMHSTGQLHGLQVDVPVDVYHAFDCPGLSSSFVKNALRYSYGHAYDWRSEYKTKSESLLVGSALHDMVLQPESFNRLWCVLPEGMRRDKRSKDYQAFLMENNGKETLSADQAETVKAMAERLVDHPKAGVLSDKNTINEASLWWKDKETGIDLKCRPDSLFNNSVIIDLKTTSDGRPWAFSKSIHEYMYHLSAAMYIDGCRANGIDAGEFHLLAIENKFPYGIAWYALDEAAIQKGRELYMKGLQIIKEGQRAAIPQYYSTEIMPITLPTYGWTE